MKVAIQMYSVRETLAKEPLATMKSVAEMGYKYWETWEIRDVDDVPNNYGLGGLPADEAKDLLKELGVTIIGSHISSDSMYNEKKLEAFLDYQQAVGCWNPGLSLDFFPDVAFIKQWGENMNRIGQMCRDRGMHWHYHNHYHEFQVYEGRYVTDWILEFTDPALVDFELDTFWAARAGVDPVAMIERYADRLVMLHQKDFAKNAPQKMNLFDGIVDPDTPITTFEAFRHTDERCFAEVGTGTMDIQAIIDAGNQADIPYITLEQDKTQLSELESVKVSMDAFRKYSGIEWA